MFQHSYKNFNNFLGVNRLVYFEQAAAETPESDRDAVLSAEEVFGEDAADTLMTEAEQAGRAAYEAAMRDAMVMLKGALPVLNTAFKRLGDDETRTEFLRQVEARIQIDAEEAFRRDGDYGAVIKAYDLRSVDPKGPKEAVVQAALNVVAPKFKFVSHEEALGKLVEDVRFQERIRILLKDPRSVAKKAQYTRDYLRRNKIDSRDLGIQFEDEIDYFNDEKLVTAVARLQNDLRLNWSDIDGALGQETYTAALGQGKLKPFYQGPILEKDFAKVTPGKRTYETVEQIVARAKGKEVASILTGRFQQTPSFQALAKVYDGIRYNQEIPRLMSAQEGESYRQQRERFLEQLALDLTQRLSHAPNMNPELLDHVLGTYLRAITEKVHTYRDKESEAWISSALDKSQELYASPKLQKKGGSPDLFASR